MSFYRRKNFSNPKKRENIWVINFTDFMALMLTFFVLLYSMSSPNQGQLARIARGLGAGAGEGDYGGSAWNRGAAATAVLTTLKIPPGQNIDYLEAIVTQNLKSGMVLNADIRKEDGALIVALRGGDIFQSGPGGQTEISPQGHKALARLSTVLQALKNRIGVRVDKTVSWQDALQKAALAAADLRASGYAKPMSVMTAVRSGGAAEEVRFIVFPDDAAARPQTQNSLRIE